MAGAEWVFNATGGNNLMTLGFVEVFREWVDRIIDTDTAHGRIEVIHDRHVAHLQPESMDDVLDVPRDLAVQGFYYSASVSDDASRMARIQARHDMAMALAHQAARSDGFIGFINGMAHRAMGEQSHELVQPVQRLNEALHGEWRALRAARASGVAQAGGVPHGAGQHSEVGPLPRRRLARRLCLPRCEAMPDSMTCTWAGVDLETGRVRPETSSMSWPVTAIACSENRQVGRPGTKERDVLQDRARRREHPWHLWNHLACHGSASESSLNRAGWP